MKSPTGGYREKRGREGKVHRSVLGLITSERKRLGLFSGPDLAEGFDFWTPAPSPRAAVHLQCVGGNMWSGLEKHRKCI